MIDYISVIFVFVIAYLLTGMLRSYALKRSLLDIPNDRSSHLLPTPRGGGLAIVVPFLTAVLLFFLFGKIPADAFWALFIGGAGIAAVGVVDDRGHVPARWRLLVHFLTATFALFCFGWAPGILFSAQLWVVWVGNIACLFIVVWMLNLFNFMDGIDAIASVEAISVSLGAALIIWGHNGQSSNFLILLLLASSCLGFLVWNWPPAKIFMGDVGSAFLGFILAILAIYTTSLHLISPWSWLILLGVFLVDATITLLSRMFRGEVWYEAHCSHAYQSATRRYGSHKKVSLAVLLINVCWLFPLAWAATSWFDFGSIFAVLGFVPLVGIVVIFRDHPVEDS